MKEQEIFEKRVKWDFNFWNSKPIEDCNATWSDIWFIYITAFFLIIPSIFILIGHIFLSRKVYYVKQKLKETKCWT